MTKREVPAPVLDLLEGLDSAPDEATQRFVQISRWAARKRTPMSPTRHAAEISKAYREGVARLLGQLANVLLYEDVSCRDLLHKNVRLGEVLHLPEVSCLRRRSERALEAARESSPSLREELACLSKCRAEDKRIDRLEPILLAWRLCPMDNLAILGAIEYSLRKEWESALTMLESVLHESISILNRSIAYEVLGTLFLARAEPRQAAEAFRESFLRGEDRPAALCSWFVASVALGSIGEIEMSGRAIEDMLGSDDVDLDFCTGPIRARRRKSLFDARVHPSLDRARIVFGQHTSRIIDALPS